MYLTRSTPREAHNPGASRFVASGAAAKAPAGQSRGITTRLEVAVKVVSMAWSSAAGSCGKQADC
jgi:hypothetical protein